MSHAVIGAAIAVHRELGPGYLEAVYDEALAVELAIRGIMFERQFRVPIYYRARLVGETRLDLVVQGLIVVELKAIDDVRPLHHAQVNSYLRAGAFQLGLLINFNVPRLIDGVYRHIWTG